MNYKTLQKAMREKLRPKSVKGYKINLSRNRVYRRANKEDFMGENVQTVRKGST